MTFDGQVALVTGGSRGIGRAIALGLATKGAAVAVNYRSDEASAQDVVDRITSEGGTAVALRADVTDADSVETLVEKARAELGDIDVLVNNAGVASDGLLWDIEPDEWWRVLSVNLGGTYHGIRAVAEQMMSRRGGAVVNVSSAVGSRGWIGESNYAASKGAVEALTRAAAIEMARFGVRVNAVAPGYAPTDLVDRLLEKSGDKIRRQIPMRSLATPEQVADAVCFLASDSAAYITGEVLRVDGGFSAQLGLGRPG